MNVYEDYKYYVKKRITSKEYAKETKTNYQSLNKDEVDKLITDKLMIKFKTWV